MPRAKSRPSTMLPWIVEPARRTMLLAAVPITDRAYTPCEMPAERNLLSAARSSSGSGRSERAAARPSQALSLTSEEVPLVRLDPCPAAILRVHLDELLFGRNPSRQRAVLVVRVRHRKPVGLPGQIGQRVAERRKLPVQHAKDPWQHTAVSCCARERQNWLNERLTRLGWMQDEIAEPKVPVADAGGLDDRVSFLLQVLTELGHERWLPAHHGCGQRSLARH